METREGRKTPLLDQAFLKRSLAPVDIEERRRWEEIYIRYFQPTVPSTVVETIIDEGGGDGDFCLWTLEGTDIVRYGGNVGVGIHPNEATFEVRGTVCIEDTDARPILEIRNWSDTEYDPLIHWSLGATPLVRFSMGVDDSDSDKWKISNLQVLGTLAESQAGYGDLLVYFHVPRVSFVGLDLDDFSTDSFVYSTTWGSGDGQRNSLYQDTYDGVYIYYNDINKVQKVDAISGVYISKYVYPSQCWGVCHWAGKLYAINITEYGSPAKLHIYKIDADTMTLDADYDDFVWGTGDDGFRSPRGMATDGMYLYICDFSNGRIKKTTMAGAYVDEVAAGTPISCEVDDAYLYVCDMNSGSEAIRVFNKSDLAVVDVITPEVVNGHAGTPTAIAINGTYFYVFVSRTAPDQSIDRYDIATRTYQDSYDTYIDGARASVTWSMHIAKYATSGIKYGDLLVLHHDGQYFDVYPKTRFADDIRLVQDGDDIDGDYVGLRAPATVGTSYALTFPADLPAGQSHVSCNASGILSFGQDVNTTASPSFVALTLTQAIGTAPMTIASTTVVTNLNADLLDGNHAAAFAVAAHNHDWTYEPALGNPDVDGKVLSSTAAGVRSWIAPGGGAAAFLDLTDVDEADYTGHAGHFVVVNGDEDALVFTASSVAAHDLASASHGDVDATGLSDDDILRYDSASGEWKCEALPASANHDVLDGSVHGDTLAGAVSRGSIIYGNSTPKWAELVVGAAGYLLSSDGVDASWQDALSGILLGHRIPGRYYSTNLTCNPGTGTSAFALNVLYALPFLVGRRTAFDRINVRVTSAAGAGSNARLGIYTSLLTTGLPDALLVDSGEIDISSTGVKEANITVTLTPGMYWLAYLGEATATFQGFTAIGIPSILGMPNSSTYTAANYCSVAQAYGALPNPFTAGSAMAYAATAAYIMLRAA